MGKGRKRLTNSVLVVTDCGYHQKKFIRDGYTVTKSRHHLKKFCLDGYAVTVFTTNGGTIQDTLQLANYEVSCFFKTVVIGGLFWDNFHSRGSNYNDKNHILIPCVDKPNITELAQLIVSSSKKWRANFKVNIIWVLPYKADILKYNKNMENVKTSKTFVMTPAEEVEAAMAADRIQNYAKFVELFELVQQADTNSVVHFVQLDEFVLETDIGRSENGLHMFEGRNNIVMAALLRLAMERKCLPTPGAELQATSQPPLLTVPLGTCRLTPEAQRYAYRIEEDLFGENMNDTLTEDERRMLLGISIKEWLNESNISYCSEQSCLRTPPSKNKSVKRSYTQMVEQRAVNCDMLTDDNCYNTNSNVDTSDESQLSPYSFQTLQNCCGVESNTSPRPPVCQSSISNNPRQGLLAEEITSCTSPDNDIELPRCDNDISSNPPAEGIEVMLCGLGDSGNSVSCSVDRWTQIVGTPPEPPLPSPKLPFSTELLSQEQKQLKRAEAKMRYFNKELLLSNKRESATQTPNTRMKTWRRKMNRNSSHRLNNVFQTPNSD